MMSTLPEIGDIVLLTESDGDRPAIITKVFSATQVEATAFLPIAAPLKLVTIHQDRRGSIHAGTKDATGYHGIMKPTRKG